MGNYPLSVPASNYANSSTWATSPAFIFGASVCDCSGHGHCVEGQRGPICVCDDGWSGASDFPNAENVQCHTNIWAIRGLWILNLTILFYVLFHTIPILYTSTLRTMKRSARGKKNKKKGYGITANKGLLSMLWFHALCPPFQLAVALLVMADPNRLIGTDPLITCMWIIARSGTYVPVAIHQPALVARLLRAQNNTQQVVKRAKQQIEVLCIFATCSGLLAVPVLATNGLDVDVGRAMFVLYCFCQVVVFSGLALNSMMLVRQVRDLLTASYESTKSTEVLVLRDMIIMGQKKSLKQMTVQIIVFSVFLVAPPLWICHRWLLPISWIGPPLTAKAISDSIDAERHKQNTADTQYQQNHPVVTVENSTGGKSLHGSAIEHTARHSNLHSKSGFKSQEESQPFGNYPTTQVDE